MVPVYTQYRKHYKRPCWDDFALSEYNRKRDYRIGRRSVEHQHQPWEWESSESETDFQTSRQTKKYPQVSEKKEAHRQRNSKNGRNTSLAGKGESKSDKTLVKQALGPEQDGERSKQQATQTTHTRHHKSKRKKAAKSKTKAKVQGLVEREREQKTVPFISYGWANDAPIEKKYTHNVRADAKDVYPASLRALKRRELDIRKKLEENKKKALLEREMIKEQFFNLSHISPMFLTEYQSSYCNMGGAETGYVW